MTEEEAIQPRAGLVFIDNDNLHSAISCLSFQFVHDRLNMVPVHLEFETEVGNDAKGYRLEDQRISAAIEAFVIEEEFLHH